MSIKTFISEFQDYLFNLEPLFNRLDVKRASKTDYFGAHKNAETIIESFKESIEFLETNGIDINKEVEGILKGLNNKLDKVDTFSSAIIGINSSQDSYKELLTVHPFLLSNTENWESIQRCLLLPIISSYNAFQPYSNTLREGKGVARFTISDKYATKYISIDKELNTQLVSISYLNDDKEQLSASTLPDTLNKSNVILEIPINTRYISLDYYHDIPSELKITPLTFKHSSTNTVTLGKQNYDYGNLLVFNSNVDLPKGCYAILDLNLSFRDVNGKEVLNKQAKIPLNSDGFTVDLFTDVPKDAKIKGYWLNNVYTEEELNTIPDNAYVLYKTVTEEDVELFTESALKFNVKNAKKITVTTSLKLYSLSNTTQTPRLFYLTGMTKNV